jgi:hypothetical protein
MQVIKGIKYKYAETAELIHRANIESYSVSRREYEESHVDATMANHRAVGYTMMAEDLEPYNPYVLWERGFIAELSGKSNLYMENVTANNIKKIDECNKYGYTRRDHTYKIMKFALKDYRKMIKKGKLYQGTKA